MGLPSNGGKPHRVPTSDAALTLKGTPSDKDTAAPSGRADPSGRASQAQAHNAGSDQAV